MPDVERLKQAIPWTPTPEQLRAAAELASAFYEAGQEDEYSFDQFAQDVEMFRSEIANDNTLDSVAGLTEEMLLLLHAYGEASDWQDLTPATYKAWAHR
jgi:hypothetical protein